MEVGDKVKLNEPLFIRGGVYVDAGEVGVVRSVSTAGAGPGQSGPEVCVVRLAMGLTAELLISDVTPA